MQLCRLIYYYFSALHFSGDVFAHHQEHLTVFTASVNIHQCRCRLVSPAGSDIGEFYGIRRFITIFKQVRHCAPSTSRQTSRQTQCFSVSFFGSRPPSELDLSFNPYPANVENKVSS